MFMVNCEKVYEIGNNPVWILQMDQAYLNQQIRS